MANTVEETVVRKSVRVQAPVERAFSVFVEQMETWWPATHHIGSTPFEAIFVEPRVGGRWYERNAEGRAVRLWGTVLAWDPPRLVRFSWHLGPGHDSPEWKFDPDMAQGQRSGDSLLARGPGRHPGGTGTQQAGTARGRLRAIARAVRRPGAWSGILE